MKRILITGAAGNIGTEVIRHLYALNTTQEVMEVYSTQLMFLFISAIRVEALVDRFLQGIYPVEMFNLMKLWSLLDNVIGSFVRMLLSVEECRHR